MVGMMLASITLSVHTVLYTIYMFTWYNGGHDAGIYHPQATDSFHPEPVVHHTYSREGMGQLQLAQNSIFYPSILITRFFPKPSVMYVTFKNL